MPWSGSGDFNRLYSWVADALAGLDISSQRTDDDTDDITSNGFGNCLTRDGQGSASADQPMNGFNHTGVGDASKVDQYPSVDQIQQNSLLYAVAAGTADAITGDFGINQTAFTDGRAVLVKALLANTVVDPTFKAHTLAAKTITKFGGNPLVAGDIAGLGHELELCYCAATDTWELLNPATSKANIPWDAAGGTANAITAAYIPANGSLPNGLLLSFRAFATNTSGTVTFAPDGLTAQNITKGGDGSDLAVGDLRQHAEYLIRYNLNNTRWELLNPELPAVGVPVILDSGNLSTGTAVALTFDFTPYSAYTRFEIQIDNLTRSGASILAALFSTDGGTSYINSGYAYVISILNGFTNVTSAADTSLHLTDSVPDTSLQSANIFLSNINDGSAAVFLWGMIANGSYYAEGAQGTTGVNAIQLKLLSNTVTGGKYRIIGYV